ALRYAFTSLGPGPDGRRPRLRLSADAPLHMVHVERIASICPRVAAAIPRDIRLSGETDLLASVNFNREDGDWTLHSSLGAQADSLSINAPGQFVKPAGETLNVALAEHCA